MSFNNMPMQGYDGWGVNAPYMTPSYMANFRPGYEQGTGQNPYAQNHSVGQSLWALGPGDLGYGADALSSLSAHRYNISNAGFDAGMSGLQSVAIPLASWYAADRMIGRTGMASAAGRAGANMGSRMAGWGARRMGMGGVAAGASRLGLGTMAAGAGSLAGGLLLPMVAGQALASVADSTFIDPYVSTRRGMDAMKANTANTFVAGGGGSSSGGFGMSATRAQEISQALTVAGQQDFSLSGGDYNQIADNMMRAGIFQEVGDMDTNRIVDGVKKATSVLKMISRITGDNDIQAGVQTLAMLKSGGLDDIDKMGSALQQIRNASAVSGTSVNQILDTVGNQGMVMAQQAGMRGVTGLLASADAYAGFTNARRSGLISGAQMQALGGAEGMTQNVMSGVMSTMSSPYARMVMQGGGKFGGGLSNNIAKWGQGVSGDPINAQGDWFLNQGAYTDAAINQNGGVNMTLKVLQDMARTANLDPDNGRHIAAMAQQAGLSPQEFRSIVELDRSRGDTGSRMRAGQGRAVARRSDFASEMQQEGLGMIGMSGIGDAQLMWRQFKSAVKGAGATAMSPISELGADISDWWSEMDANMKGTSLDYQSKSYIINEEGEGGLFQLEGRKMLYAGKDMRTGKEVRKLAKMADDSQNPTIAALNRAYQNATGADKDKIGRAYQAIVDGKHSLAAQLIGEVDETSNGAISGKKDKLDRQKYISEFELKLSSGQISATRTSMGTDEFYARGSSGSLSEGDFLASMTQGESGAAGYDAKVYGNRFSAGFNPSTSSVSEVLAQQKLSRSRDGNSAVGKFQFIYPTLKALTDTAISEGRLDPDQKFDKGVQDMLAKDLAMRDPDIAAYVNSPNPTAEQEEKAMNAMAGIWASFPMANGDSRYKGKSGNKAHVSRSQSRSAVKDFRAQMNKPVASTPTKTGDISGDKDLLDRLASKGISKADASSYLSTLDYDTQIKLLNSGDVDKNLDKMVKKISAQKEADKSATNDPSSINWEGVVDVRDGISKLGSATVANTTSLDKLTNAIERQISQDARGFFGTKPTVEKL